jgi:thiol:disulfide interchange protein/DsbC/DsbD-like thiol-disulfide interchange protein
MKIIRNRQKYAFLLSLAALMLLGAGSVFFAAAETSSSALEESFGTNSVLAFLGVFLLGLALNLTPCVYPMLTITVSIFGNQKESRPGVIALRALLYILGIATMYSVLGLVAALTGGLFGAVLQSPVVLIAIAVLFFILSLSMFGVYELQAPPALLNKMGGAGQVSGLFGKYVSGLFVGIFAAPCIGPPVVALLAMVGQRGDPLFGFMIFFVLSLGLGLPYLFLALFSGMLSSLPKSGEWMNWIKKLMGVLLVGVGVFYLSLALDPSLTFVLIPLVLLAGGIYLAGAMKKGQAPVLFIRFTRVIGLLFILSAVWLFFAGRTPSLTWPAYEEDFFAEAADENVSLLYFSADWCVPCLEMSRLVFTDQEVRKTLNEIHRAKVDLTHFDSPESVELRKEYDVAGVPTIIFLRNGSEVPGTRIVGYAEKEDLLQNLESLDSRKTDSFGLSVTKEESSPRSTLSLVADKAWVTPGEPLRLGAWFSLDDEWHIYWKNAGDSGNPPQLEWDVPFPADDSIHWPAPQRFSDGPVVTFGRENELLLSRKIYPPDTLQPGDTLYFSIEGTWLICRDICIAEDGAAELRLPVKHAEAPASDDYEKFARAEHALPQSDTSWQIRGTQRNDHIELLVQPPAEFTADMMLNSEFFPAQRGVVGHDAVSWKQSDKEDRMFTLTLPRGKSEPEEHFSGVLVFTEDAPYSALSVEVRLDEGR